MAVEKKRIILRHSRPSFLLLLYENDDKKKTIIFTPMKLRGEDQKEGKKGNEENRKGDEEYKNEETIFRSDPSYFTRNACYLITRHLRRVPSVRFSTLFLFSTRILNRSVALKVDHGQSYRNYNRSVYSL